METINNDTANRTLQIIKTVNAKIDLVWDAWTKPKHIARWWGPNGFTCTILKMDFIDGGEWQLTLHGPDGTNYPNKSIFKEIVLLQKIVFEHFNPHFFATVLFEPKGEETVISWSMLFDTAEMFDIIVKAHKVDEGQKQNVERLENYLSDLLNDPTAG